MESPIHSTWVKQRAQALGFQLVGITTPDPPDHLDVYRHWVGSGRHADMAYMARPDAIQKREDPRLLLPECRSIIVTGTLYGSSDLDHTTEFKIAKYALGKDYHHELINRLQMLQDEIEAHVGGPVNHRIYADTGPLLEREIAQRAGLGWIGKNSCLINPNLGSYFLLAELMLDLPLEPDAPFLSDRCGSCSRCIEACPTRCILPDRTLDAGRCISYLTIENKGLTSPGLREHIGNWLFGCDICQQVCPWNIRFARPITDTAFLPSPYLRRSQLKGFLRLSPDTWRQDLRNSPLERPRRKGLVRNATIVAGNHASEEYLDDLIYILEHDKDAMVRAHAAWALHQIDHPKARTLLESQLDLEQDPEVLQAIKGE